MARFNVYAQRIQTREWRKQHISDNSLDPKYWGPPPTRWQRLTAYLWQLWLRVSKR